MLVSLSQRQMEKEWFLSEKIMFGKIQKSNSPISVSFVFLDQSYIELEVISKERREKSK
jgi:hypothetical protein